MMEITVQTKAKTEFVDIKGGRLALGAWQRVFLAGFDGPRRRTIKVKLLGGK